MERPPSWHACAVHPADGPLSQSPQSRTVDNVSYTLVTSAAGPPPAQISKLILPMSKQWCCDTELISLEPTMVTTDSTAEQQRVEYRATRVGSSPGDTHWAVGLVLIEQPISTYAGATLGHTNNLSYEHWECDRLLRVAAQCEQTA
jgi:hypothetical protein